MVSDPERGDVLEVNAVPTEDRPDALTGVSLNGDTSYFGFPNRPTKTILSFDIKVLEGENRLFLITQHIASSRATYAPKWVLKTLDDSADWQTIEVDISRLASPGARYLAREVGHYFTLISGQDPVRYQLDNIKLIQEPIAQSTFRLAVREDEASIAEIDAVISDLPLLSGFSSTDALLSRRQDGMPAEVFGFVLEEDGSMFNFDTYGLTPNAIVLGVGQRDGTWTGDSSRTDLKFCGFFVPYGADPAYPECDNYYSRHRTWEYLQARDIDGDGEPDRVYMLETIRALIDEDGNGQIDSVVSEDLDDDGRLDVAEDLNGNGVLDDGEDVDGDGKLDPVDEDTNNNGTLDRDHIRWSYSRTNFYEIGRDFDIDDVDGDGVSNFDDALPLDYRDSLDTDLDGIGNSVDSDDDGDGVPDTLDAFPLDPFETVDSDGDGVGNAADSDDDGDGIPDRLDAFPYDPSESVDTDGDGIGNNRDEDDDNDTISDDQDESPLGNGQLDDDGDGVFNRDDADVDGDGVPDVIAELLKGERTSLAFAVRVPGYDATIPSHAIGYYPYTASLGADGRFVQASGETAGINRLLNGVWSWDSDAQGLYMQLERRVVHVRLDREVHENINWGVYEEAGSPAIAFDRIDFWRYTLIPSEQYQDRWIVQWQWGYEDSVSTTQDHISPDSPYSVEDFFMEPTSGVVVKVELGGLAPAEERQFVHEEMIDPLSADELHGKWIIDTTTPGYVYGCSGYENSPDIRPCQHSFDFLPDGTGVVAHLWDPSMAGQFNDRVFSWDISNRGTVLIDLIGYGAGSIELIPNRQFADGSTTMMVLTRDQIGNVVTHAQAIKRDLGESVDISLRSAVSGNTFLAGYAITDPFRPRKADGEIINARGRIFSESGAFTDFNTWGLRSFEGARVVEGSGEQSKAPMIFTLRPVITRFVSLRLPTSIQPDAQRGRLGYRMLSVLPCCQKMSMKGRSIGRIMR